FCRAVSAISRISMTRTPSSRSFSIASRRLPATTTPARTRLRSLPSYLKRPILFLSFQERLSGLSRDLALCQQFLHGSCHHVHAGRTVRQDDVWNLVHFLSADQVCNSRI